MKFLFWLLILAIGVTLALFAVSNREAVSLGLWPLSDVLELPLYLAILAALALGFIVGVLAVWLCGWRTRSQVRRHGRRIAALERERATPPAPPSTAMSLVPRR